jgi:hypothetical protein
MISPVVASEWEERNAQDCLCRHAAASKAFALCVGQSPDQQVIFEYKFADNAADWVTEHGTLPAISNGIMTIPMGCVATVVPKLNVANAPLHAAGICVQFSWPSANTENVPLAGIMTEATFDYYELDLMDAGVCTLEKDGTLSTFSLPPVTRANPNSRS